MKLLLDEMFPLSTAQLLRNDFGRDAVHVSELGLAGAPDHLVALVARAEGRAVVTENVADFAAEQDLVQVCVLKRNLPSGRGQAHALAVLLDNWAARNPQPYAGQHWPL